MKKALHRSILFFTALAISMHAFSAAVSVTTAQSAAVSFFKLNATNAGHSTVTATLKYTQTEANGTVDFYVFDMSPGNGFVMISADDRLSPILGYSLENNFTVPQAGSSVHTWMQHAGTHIAQAIQRNVPVSTVISSKWSSYLQGQRPPNAKSAGSAVTPLLQTTWDQEPYYNQLCPFNATDNQRALTGCVATAMAQIMKYWNYPARGTGYYGYFDGPPNFFHTYGSQSANFGNTTYNWANMPSSLSANNSSVATLMYQCGVAVGMDYGDDNEGGSGSYVLAADVSSTRHTAQMAFPTYFSYNPNTIQGIHMSDYTSVQWLAIIEGELSAGRPVQYAGTDVYAGSHTWVCDGFDVNDLLHMNWGWGGLDNGYYNIASLTADNYNFSTNEEALIGIEPINNLSVTASSADNSICKGGTTILSATTHSANATYVWLPTNGLSCPTCATTNASPDSTTTYTITIDSAGLSSSSQVTVNVVASTVVVNNVNVANVSAYGAANGNAGVNVSGGSASYRYVWNTHDTTSTISNLGPGTYNVTVTDTKGCTATATAHVTQPDSVSAPASNPQPGGNGGNGGGGGSVANSSYTNAALSNKGGVIYIQKSAWVYVQGDLINTLTDSTGTIKNDGVIEITGNFQNDSGAIFQVGSNSASTDRAVKFIGAGTQLIKGNMSRKGKSSFYNLVIDQANAADTVAMQTNVAVEGSVAFGSANITTTYNPTSFYTNNNKKGLLKTYDNTLGEFLLDVQNGNTDAISGYPVLEINGAPSTGFILTSGIKGSGNGGLQRAITSATSYLFPVGTYDKGFNAAKLNFTEIPGGGSVKTKFCSGSSNPSGYVGELSTYCNGCDGNYQSPSNSGYNRYFPSNECNNGAPQWLIIENTVKNHGYWSFASSNTGYKYDMEVYPNGFPAVESSAAWRLLKHEAGYGVDPSLASVNWTPEIESTVSSVTDLLTYTKNIGCYNGAGVPGGSYTGFSHFTMGMGGASGALPVQLLSLTATDAGKHHITVAWATALEINNAGFFVMRSTDGVNFSDLGWVTGHGNSTITENYTYDDRVPQNGVYYYKLRQVDNNGKFVYSYMVDVKLGDDAASSDFALYPNPTTNDIFLDVKNAAEEVKVDMYDISGQLVYNNIFTTAQAGANQTLTINASTLLPPGTYILSATMNEQKYSTKVILQ